MHKTEIEYEGGLEKLANDISDLRYDKLEDFLNKLSEKLFKDALADYKRERPQLASCLNYAHYFVRLSRDQIRNAWKISEPYMLETK